MATGMSVPTARMTGHIGQARLVAKFYALASNRQRSRRASGAQRTKNEAQMTKLPEAWTPPKMPEKLKDCIALAFKTRAKRKKLEADAERIKRDEEAIKLHLINHFKADEFAAVKIAAGTATRVASEMPQIDLDTGGWGALQKHIQRTGEFDLLEKRLGVLAARERWDSGKSIPGVKKFVKVEIKLSEGK